MYNNREEQERDDKIIGEKTPRYLIGNANHPSRLGEDIKVFARYGDFDGLKNVTAYGLFSSKYGVFVEPTLHLNFSIGQTPEGYSYVNRGPLSLEFMGELKLKPGFEEGYVYGPGAYYYPDRKYIGDITYEEATEVLGHVLSKADDTGIKPISPEELFEVLSNIRGLDVSEEKHKSR